MQKFCQKGSVRKQPFLLALRRWGPFAKRPPAAMSEDKRLFSQDTKKVSFRWQQQRILSTYLKGGQSYSGKTSCHYIV